MRVEGADFAVVFTQDYPRAVEFYGGTLGLEYSQDYGRIPGGEFPGGTIDSGVCHQAHFKDPDGNVLTLHHRYAPR